MLLRQYYTACSPRGPVDTPVQAGRELTTPNTRLQLPLLNLAKSRCRDPFAQYSPYSPTGRSATAATGDPRGQSRASRLSQAASADNTSVCSQHTLLYRPRRLIVHSHEVRELKGDS
jgi:hypothetical protein